MPDAFKPPASDVLRRADPPPPNDLTWTGERLVPSATGDFVGEHLHRYALALEFAGQCDVLDAACGEGYGSAFLAKVARSVVGVDCDAPTIAHASAKYRSKNLRFSVGRMEKLPVPESSVDLVVSFETIEHLDDHDAMLLEIKRVLRPGGRLLISTPDSQPYRTVSGQTNPYHVRELDRQGFERLLARYFKQTTLGYQRSVSGSWISPLDAKPVSSAEYTGDFREVVKTKPGAAAPYLVALASDLPVPALSSSLFNLTQELLSQLQALTQERALERKAFSTLKTEFDQRTAWAISLEKDLQTTKDNFARLTREHDERTAWAQKLDAQLGSAARENTRLQAEHNTAVTWAKALEAELSKARAAHLEQTRLVEERTAWAASLEKEAQAAQEKFAQLAKEHMERTSWARKLQAELDAAAKEIARLQAEHGAAISWAKTLDADLAGARAAHAEQSKAVLERTEWARSLELELQSTRGNFVRLSQEHAERTAWAQALDRELSRLRAENEQQQKLVLELNGIKEACVVLAEVLTPDRGHGEIALIEQCRMTLANLLRDLAARNSETNEVKGALLDARLRAEMTEVEVSRLGDALSDAQLHVENLLAQHKSLQSTVNALNHDRQSAAESIRQYEQLLATSLANLQDVRQQLARYETNLICRLAARFSSSSPEISTK